jgi:integrase
MVAAGLGPPAKHALISLLALNGLRVSEATGADIEHLGLERGHRTLVTTRKGGKVVTILLAPRAARVIDLATGERTEGPLLVTAEGRRLDRHGAARIVRRVTRRADRQERQPAHAEARSSPPRLPGTVRLYRRRPPFSRNRARIPIGRHGIRSARIGSWSICHASAWNQASARSANRPPTTAG